jgi:hypothetical protein
MKRNRPSHRSLIAAAVALAAAALCSIASASPTFRDADLESFPVRGTITITTTEGVDVVTRDHETTLTCDAKKTVSGEESVVSAGMTVSRFFQTDVKSPTGVVSHCEVVEYRRSESSAEKT